jgi:formylglycine-generating enzyme required for sulfatase activity
MADRGGYLIMASAQAPAQDQLAEQLISRFVRRFDSSYEWLLYYAALPLVLTPELLNYLRNQFLRDRHVPWVSEVDLLLSDLCSPVGDEQYAMDSHVRDYLIRKALETLGQAELERVAKLLIRYVDHLSRSNQYLTIQERRSQQWAAMVFIDSERGRVVKDIAEAFQASSTINTGRHGVHFLANQAEMLRLSRITQKLAPQLMEHEALVQYAQSVTQALQNPESLKPGYWQQEFRVEDVTLTIPDALKRNRSDEYDFSGVIFPILDDFPFTEAHFDDSNVDESVRLWPPPLNTEEYTIVTFYEDIYGQLRKYLVETRWRDADIETTRLMLKIVGKKEGAQFSGNDFHNFPCEDLQIIDRLWQDNSKGKFGFSIQQRMFSDFCGGEIQWNNWIELFNLVGWHDVKSPNLGFDSGGWLSTTTYSIDAPNGHLPVLGVGDVEGYKYALRSGGWLEQDWLFRRNSMQHLFARLNLCQSNSPQELQPFGFDFATVIKRNDQWEIQRQQSRADQFIELLPDNLPLEMVSIPAGTFLMGSPEDDPERYDVESPQHEVNIDTFFMGRYPITQTQWRVVSAMPQVDRALNPAPSHFKGDNRPVEQVTWYDALEFCERLSKNTGRLYRLPTEAEWEYACRAGTTTPFHFGETITTVLANFNGEFIYNDTPKGGFRRETTSVGYFKICNAFGLSDMHGNVFDFCQDHSHHSYEGAPINGTAWLNKNNDDTWLSEDYDNVRVYRGGSWSENPRNCRSASRSFIAPNRTTSSLGFRVVFSVTKALQ